MPHAVGDGAVVAEARGAVTVGQDAIAILRCGNSGNHDRGTHGHERAVTLRRKVGHGNNFARTCNLRVRPVGDVLGA